MPKKNAKTKRADAERAAEWVAHEIFHCVVTCRSVRTQWQRQDMFSSDVIGKKRNGSMVFIQATAGGNQAVSVRRKKLEKIPWQETDYVYVLQLIQTEDPANARKKLWFFRQYYYHQYSNEWIQLTDAITVPKEWFKAYKNRNT